MVRFKVLTFAAASEIVGADHCYLELPAGATVADLRATLVKAYPAFAELLSFAIARNEAYAAPEEVLVAGDELVVIPPVSGG
ncbi:MAG: MoaD/ThiS family protein [Bacteroidota bacterium]